MGVNWSKDIDQTLVAAKEQFRPILLDFSPTGLSRFKGYLALLWETRFRRWLEASALRKQENI